MRCEKCLPEFPYRAHSRVVNQANQVKTLVCCDVAVDQSCEERDQDDALNPLYLVGYQPDGIHGGSMRFLPTTGRVMVNEIFGHLTGGVPICSPFIWECTRFCLARDASSKVAAALMLGGGEIMRNFSVEHFVGVFDRRMIRIYRAIGSSPEVLGTEGTGRDQINVGLWEFTPGSYDMVAQRAGIAPETSRVWFDRSFGGALAQPMALSA